MSRILRAFLNIWYTRNYRSPQLEGNHPQLDDEDTDSRHTNSRHLDSRHTNSRHPDSNERVDRSPSNQLAFQPAIPAFDTPIQAEPAPALLQSLFASIADLAFVMDAQGHYIDIMPTQPTLPYKPIDQLLGKALHEVLPQSQAEQLLERTQQALTTQRPVLFEHTLLLDQETAWFEVTISPLPHQQVVVVVRDITDRKEAELELRQAKADLEQRVEQRTIELQHTIAQLEEIVYELGAALRERKQAEQALQTNQQILHGIINSIPDLIIRLRRDGTYLGFMAAKEFVRLDQDDWRGKTVAQMHPQEFARQRMYYVEQAFQTAEVQIYEQILEINEQTKFEEVRVIASNEDEALLIVRDISDRKRSEQEKEQIAHELRQSQQFLQCVIDNIPQRIFWKDRNSVYLGCNRALANAVGLSDPVDIIGKTDYDLVIPPERATLYREKDIQVMETKQADLHTVTQEVLADGRQIWIDANKVPLQDITGQVVGILGTYEDITERVRAEERLKTSREFLNCVLDSVPDPVFVKDEQHRWILLNRMACEFVGLSHEELIGKSDYDVSPPEQAALFWEKDQQVLTTGIENVNEEYHTDIHGNLRFIATKKVRFIDTSGNKFIIGIIRDLTERKTTEDAIKQSELQVRQKAAELEQALKELQQAQAQLIQSEKMSSLGQLVAGVAHEINNPVSFIYGNLSHAQRYTREVLELIDLYQQHYPEPVSALQAKIKAIELPFLIQDLPKLLNSMQVGADRIEAIVRSLRIFSHADEAEVKPVNIHDGIDSTLLILQNRLKERGDRLGIEVIKDYGELPLVECYAGQLNQVFMNVLSNAIDALEDMLIKQQVNSNSEPRNELMSEEISHITDQPFAWSPTIYITTQLTDRQRVLICIADNGPGMPESIKQRIFDPFFTTKPVGKGTGMGMSISYQIVTEKHGGQFECISQPGQGTKFMIQIPLHQADCLS